MRNNSNNVTSEQFLDKINVELSIVKKQLLELTIMYNSFEENYYKANFMKITVPEFYAKYEGFFKYVFNETILYLLSLNLENRSININYLVFPLLTYLDSNTTNQKSKAKKIMDVFDKSFNENCNFLNIFKSSQYTLNLDSTEHTMRILNIDIREFQMGQLYILYNRRNEIAHGNMSEDNPFYISSNVDITDSLVRETYDYWKEHYECVVSSVSTMADSFINYISNEEYLII